MERAIVLAMEMEMEMGCMYKEGEMEAKGASG